MTHEQTKFNNTESQDNQKMKRHLSRQLIQHIMSLYDSIIQKIEHGIGLLWEEYFSKQLFNIAKLRLQHQLINDMAQLNNWFDKISTNLRDKVTSLSANLLGHFDEIIQQETQFLYLVQKKVLSSERFDLLEENQVDKREDIFLENKLNQSLYETCTESSRGKQKKLNKQRLQTVSSQSLCSDELSKSFTEDQSSFMDAKNTNDKLTIVQPPQNLLLRTQKKCSKQKPRKQRKISSNHSSEHEQEVQGGFYGVFLGLLEAFDM